MLAKYLPVIKNNSIDLGNRVYEGWMKSCITFSWEFLVKEGFALFLTNEKRNIFFR